MPPVLRAIVLLLLPVTANFVEAQNGAEPKTLDDVSAFMQSYYLHPQPDRIAPLIDVLYRSGFVQKRTNELVIIGFFSEVFAANPNRLPEWEDHIRSQDERTKALLERAVSVSKTGGLLSEDGHSAQLNDGWWAGFFASGNTKFIDRIVDQLEYFDNRTDQALFFAGATAKWSLASNARSQRRVRSAIEHAKTTAKARKKELINEVLNDDPIRIKQEISEIVKTQTEAGTWK